MNGRIVGRRGQLQDRAIRRFIIPPPHAKQPVICGNKTTEDVCLRLIPAVCQLLASSRWRAQGGLAAEREGFSALPVNIQRLLLSFAISISHTPSSPPHTPKPHQYPPPPLPSGIVRSSVLWKDDRARSNWSSRAESRGRKAEQENKEKEEVLFNFMDKTYSELWTFSQRHKLIE